MFANAEIKFAKKVDTGFCFCYIENRKIIVSGRLLCLRKKMGVNGVYISYNKLWKMLIDRNMNKQMLKTSASVSSASIAKLGKGENVTTDVLVKICTALKCDISDIMELVPDER